MHETKIWSKADKDGFCTAVITSRLEQKSPATECLVCCVCVLFSMKKSMIRMGSWFVSIAITFYFFALSAAKVPLGQCSGVSLLESNSLRNVSSKSNF